MGQNGDRDLFGVDGFHNISRARCFVSNERWTVRPDYIGFELLFLLAAFSASSTGAWVSDLLLAASRMAVGVSSVDTIY